MFSFTSIADYHSQLTGGAASCTDTVSHYLKRIEEKQHLNAFTEVYGAEALERAEALDRQRAAGAPLKKLHGVVIAIKDVICYKGKQVSAASNILKGFNSLYTASAVQFLLDEDASQIPSFCINPQPTCPSY